MRAAINEESARRENEDAVTLLIRIFEMPRPVLRHLIRGQVLAYHELFWRT